MGRPTKLNDEIQKRMCNALTAGCSKKGAAAYGHISYETFRAWMRKGEKCKSGKYSAFSVAIKKAIDESEAMLLVEIRNDKAWQSNAWIMERRWPDRWGRVERREISGPEGGPVQVVELPKNERD